MSARTTNDLAVGQVAQMLAAGDGADRSPPVSVDWPAVVRFASPTLAPALWSATRKLDLLQPVPPGLMKHLKQGPRAHPAAVLAAAHQDNERRADDLFSQLGDVATALSARDIQPVALKGAATTLAGVWPDPADRVMADVDLLVPEARGHASSAGLGGSWATRSVDRCATSLHHLPPLRREDRFGAFELHVRPMTNAWTTVLTADEVRDSACGGDDGPGNRARPLPRDPRHACTRPRPPV